MMKAKLLLALALLTGGASFAQAGVFIGARFGYGGYYGRCYRCGFYARRAWGYGWYRPWYRGYWRAGYWVRPYVGAYWAPPPVAYVPPPAPVAYAPPAPAPAPAAPAPTCAPAPPPPTCPPPPAAKTCVRKHYHHHTVAHKKVTHPCTPT